MANTYTLIASNTLSSSAASVTFSAIPNTYTDLVIKISSRNNNSSTTAYQHIRFAANSISSGYSWTALQANGSSANSARGQNQTSLSLRATNQSNGLTSDTFSNSEIYIPNYNSNSTIPLSSFGLQENNGTFATMAVTAGRIPITSAITSITLTSDAASSSFISGSSFFLYGIKNS